MWERIGMIAGNGSVQMLDNLGGINRISSFDCLYFICSVT